MENKLISIIIPAYDRAYIIGETLDSIIKQTYTNWECIVIDDGSKDITKEVVDSYLIKDKRFSFYERPKDVAKGANSCRNLGLNLAKGSLIQFFDSDDLMLPNHLLEKVKIFRKENECDVVVNKLSFIENGEKTYTSNIYSEKKIIDYYTGKIAYFICGPLWKHDFLKRVNASFDIHISNLDDWDFNIRMLLHNPKIKFLDSITMLYRRYPNSLSKQINLCNTKEIKSEIYARNKILKILSENKLETKEPILFLKNRLVKLYSICLENKEYKTAIFCYKYLKKNNLNFYKKIKLFLAYISYKIFNKGYFFLKK